MSNVIVSLIILAIIGLSISRVISDKRKGRKCGGCPDAGGCTSHKKVGNREALQKIDIKELM